MVVLLVAISGYFIGGYSIGGYFIGGCSIGGYFIGGCSIGGYWWLFYWCLLVTHLLMTIGAC